MKDAAGLQENYLPDWRIACSAEISISKQMNLGKKVEDEEWGCQLLHKRRRLSRRPQTRGREFKHQTCVFLQERPCNFTTRWWRTMP